MKNHHMSALALPQLVRFVMPVTSSTGKFRQIETAEATACTLTIQPGLSRVRQLGALLSLASLPGLKTQS